MESTMVTGILEMARAILDSSFSELLSSIL